MLFTESIVFEIKIWITAGVSDHSPINGETTELICIVNQLSGFYVNGTFAFNGLVTLV